MIQNCPKCGKRMILDSTKHGEAKNYLDCRVKCETCGIAYSNAKSNPTKIFRNFKDNIPIQLHEKLEYVLENTLNQSNRNNKKEKIAFYSSEDAFTWIFFSYFLKFSRERQLFDLLFINDTLIDIYFWGTGYQGKNTEFKIKLEKIMRDDYFENTQYYTEPDIIIETKTKIFFIEIKLKSGNVSPEKKDIKKYIKKYYSNSEYAEGSNCYELIRNWSIGNSIASVFGKDFFLLNIGLKKIFNNESDKIHLFEKSLNVSNKFIRLYWDNIILIKNIEQPWFSDEIGERFKFIKEQILSK